MSPLRSPDPSRGLSEPGLGLPPRGAAPRERGARILVALMALALLAVAAGMAWSARPSAGTAPGWSSLAPPAEMGMQTWRWLVFSATDRAHAHFQVAPAPDGDPARVEVLPVWSLQQPIPGYPADAIVVAIAAPADRAAVEARLVDLAATLTARIPTLSLRRLGTDRLHPPPGLDQERLRFLVREALAKRGVTAR